MLSIFYALQSNMYLAFTCLMQAIEHVFCKVQIRCFQLISCEFASMETLFVVSIVDLNHCLHTAPYSEAICDFKSCKLCVKYRYAKLS